MDDLNVLAGEVANRMLRGKNYNRRSRLFEDLKEMALQALRKTRSAQQKDAGRERLWNAGPLGDMRALWRLPSL